MGPAHLARRAAMQRPLALDFKGKADSPRAMEMEEMVL